MFFDCAMPKRNPTIAHRKPESVTRSISFEVSVLRVESVTKPGASMPTSLSEKITRIKLSIRKMAKITLKTLLRSFSACSLSFSLLL